MFIKTFKCIGSMSNLHKKIDYEKFISFFILIFKDDIQDFYTKMVRILPIEIINKIFTYVSSNHACLIRESRFYQCEYPFFHLEHVSTYDVDNIDLQDDITDINRIVSNDRLHFKFTNGIHLNQDDLDYVDDSSDDDYDIDWYPPLIYL
jgi:hypothetical protein